MHAQGLLDEERCRLLPARKGTAAGVEDVCMGESGMPVAYLYAVQYNDSVTAVLADGISGESQGSIPPCQEGGPGYIDVLVIRTGQVPDFVPAFTAKSALVFFCYFAQNLEICV
jgi:hypothetical protein